MDEIYYPWKNLSTDKSMILWQNRLIFRQYIKSKKHKFGTKLYMLTQSFGLNLKISIYCGRKLCNSATSCYISHTEDIVMNLINKKLLPFYVIHGQLLEQCELDSEIFVKKMYYTSTLRTSKNN